MKMDKKLLYYGGIFGPIAFLLNDIIGGIVTPNYSYITNSVSDLTKAGTQDTYLLGSILLLISSLMGVAFGIGIMSHYRYKHSKLIFLGALLLAITGIFTTFTGTISKDFYLYFTDVVCCASVKSTMKRIATICPILYGAGGFKKNQCDTLRMT